MFVYKCSLFTMLQRHANYSFLSCIRYMDWKPSNEVIIYVQYAFRLKWSLAKLLYFYYKLIVEQAEI